MKNYQTRILKETAKEPTKLDFERILYQRTKYPTQNEFYSLKNLEAGALGEITVLNYLEKYGKEDWVVIQNMWMNYAGPFEGDLILLTNHRPYLFEVKNYNSDYTYENGVSTWNNKTFSGNPVNQTTRNTVDIENILYGPVKDPSREMKTQGVLALIGINNHVKIKSEVPKVDIISRAELRRYIYNIIREEEGFTGNPINKKSLIKKLERHETPRRQSPSPLLDYQIDDLHKGLYCPNCKSYDVKIGNKYTSCICGFTEVRDIAILRAICEYSVLTFNRGLKIGLLANFIGKDISKDSIRKVLRKYFIVKNKGNNTRYIVDKLPIEKLYKKLDINTPINLQLTYEEFDNLRQIIQSYEQLKP